MKRNTRTFSALLLTSAMFMAPLAQAEHQAESYGDTVGRKLLNGFANMTTSTLEIPKSIVNVSNQSNFAYGFVGGTFLGLINTAGRIGIGLLDVISAPIPTQPIVYPTYVWDNFDSETQYGPAMRPLSE